MASKPVSKKDLIREQAENDLEAFIKLVHPGRVLGAIHRELITWWTRSDAPSHQLVLLPRDHQKSALVAYRVAWEITRNPAIRVLYISSTANLATKQLKFIKDILTCDIYRFYWPEMVTQAEGFREKWSETEIAVDHPKRKAEAVRDPTVFTGGLTTVITGLHCDVAVLDDVVVYENAYTDDGRQKVEQTYSYLASIESTDSREWNVGTRYHPKDLYNTLIEKEVEIYDADGNLIKIEPLYEVFQRQVENMGDGTGEFLWPRSQRSDGRWFGFDQTILARKKAQYLDQTQFRAQYYNDPNSIDSGGIPREHLQYYDPKYLTQQGGYWFYKNNRLNVFASIDFAFSLARRADFTAIAIVGVDSARNYFILELDRFKSNNVSDYFSHILTLYQKWDFRKIRCEVTVAQSVIVNDLKQNYIRPNGLALSVEDYRPSRVQGTKEERIHSILQPRYANRQIWHYIGGNCQLLEEELQSVHPAHDDLKDALASCIDIAIAPSGMKASKPMLQLVRSNRFGGFAG
jgi:hypothetical protein